MLTKAENNSEGGCCVLVVRREENEKEASNASCSKNMSSPVDTSCREWLRRHRKHFLFDYSGKAWQWTEQKFQFLHIVKFTYSRGSTVIFFAKLSSMASLLCGGQLGFLKQVVLGK